MNTNRRRTVSGLAIFAGLFAFSGLASAQWTRIGGGNGNAGSAPGNGPANAGTCLLLTDGSVMCHEVADPLPAGSVDGTHWWRLTPDNNGKYETGTWSKLTDSSSSYGPLFYCSAVLPDGRVVIIGGEYNKIANNSSPAAETNLGYVFDPTKNSGAGQWSSAISMGTTGWTQIGDSICSVLPDKSFLIGINGSAQAATLDLNTLTLSLVNSPNLENSKADNNGEEGWTLLPNGTILTVDTANNTGTGSEIYSPSSQTWAATGNTPYTLVSNTGNPKIVPEMGPQVLRPDGTVIAFGANPNLNAFYNTSGVNAGTWSKGPTSNGDVADGPASLMPSGNVLVGFENTFFKGPSHYFEYDGTNLNPVTDPPNAGSDPTFVTTMLLLPTGQILFTDLSGDVELYTSTFAPPRPYTYSPAWRPTISSAPTNLGLGTTYPLSGTQLNGLSQASAYGDDATMATNYPLVTITNNGSGHVFYARTHDHSSMGVATGGATVSTNFDVPAGMETGASTLVVIANGIPSLPYSVNVAPGTVLTYTGPVTGDFNDTVTLSANLTSSGSPVTGVTIDFTTTFGGSCSGTTDGSGNASCTVTDTATPGTANSGTANFSGNSSFGASSASFGFTVTLEDTKLAISGPLTANFNDAVSLKARLTDPDDGTPIAGKLVTFDLGSGAGHPTCGAVTDPIGNAICTLTPNEAAGTYTLAATFTDGVFYKSASTSASFNVTLEDAKVTITGLLTSDYHDAVTVKAQLTDPDDATPIAGKTLTFVLGAGTGTETCVSGPTDASGNASCSITPNQAANTYTLSATFTDNVFYASAVGTAPFVVTKEETTIAFTAASPTVIANSHPVTFSATLLEDGTTPPVPFGQTVTFTLGSGITAQSCSGTTTATGLVSCTIPNVNQPLGPNTVGVSFAGDPYYLPSSASEPVIDFAFLASGSMIIGNLDDATNTAVEFWGATWSSANSLSGGPAPNSFKGFADNSLQSCGGNWSTSPGNSSGPPAVLPSYMGVIASTTTAQAGSTISGDGPIIVVVKTNSGYAPNAGHAGTGTVVATYCHP